MSTKLQLVKLRKPRVRYIVCPECDASFPGVIPVHTFRDQRCPGSPSPPTEAPQAHEPTAYEQYLKDFPLDDPRD